MKIMKIPQRIVFLFVVTIISFVDACSTDGDCGTGTCTATAAFGRAAGWCACPTGKYGRDCGFDWPDITSTPTNAVGGLPAAVTFELNEFSGFNTKGDEVGGLLTVTQTFTDQRTLVDAGTYTARSAAEFVQRGLLWLPSVEIAGWCSSVLSSGDLASVTLGADYETVYTEHFRVEGCPQTADWSYYPFDTQRPTFIAQPSFPTDVTWSAASSGAGGLADDGKMHQAWIYESSSATISSNSAQLDLTVKREAFSIFYKVIIPAILLGMMSWATFIIEPTNLMPRFMSGFIGFLAVQTFRAAVMADAPQGIADILSWFDVNLLYVTIQAGGCVMFVVVGEALHQVWGELIVAEFDHQNRHMIPSFFFLFSALSVMSSGEDNPLGLTTEQFLKMSLGINLVNLCVAFLWMALVTLNSDHLLMYRALQKAFRDPTAPCFLRDVELHAMFHWLEQAYGVSTVLDRSTDAGMRQPTKGRLVEGNPTSSLDLEHLRDADEEDLSERFVRCSQVYKWFEHILCYDLSKTHMHLLKAMVEDILDWNNDNHLSYEEFVDGMPRLVMVLAKHGYKLKKRSRFNLLALYIFRTLTFQNMMPRVDRSEFVVQSGSLSTTTSDGTDSDTSSKIDKKRKLPGAIRRDKSKISVAKPDFLKIGWTQNHQADDLVSKASSTSKHSKNKKT